ncbi:hypothetical protein MUK70_05130 [Dyadobacter chenwenxiniae]|uniref:Uncharacterized protein n=1 Tax=Dyadobacter chenwenxiniae TaxID=2906456 RepID=A0A9X1THB3_9BACT|nr:hypothetical protein [Dyadobacter chenwenxiniae]MCF0064570.1 hypothetical protein [Dyadobacter chenwenxiniae]UON84372.1 hypothetical protein MUK70_05130 [Dyadobacter chenwenxiniae]
MENVKEIVQQVVKIWRLFKTQQLALTAAMRQDISYDMRNLLSRDYMICLVIKKEMANLYDSLKCCMRDACITRNQQAHSPIVNDDVSMAVKQIVNVHQQIIREYRILLDLIKDTSINAAMLHQHLDQLEKMTEDLSAQSESSQFEVALD